MSGAPTLPLLVRREASSVRLLVFVLQNTSKKTHIVTQYLSELAIGAGRSGITNLTEKSNMKMLGLILIVLGALALAYGGFSYTKDSTAVKLGPLELSVKQKESVNIPVWAGIAAVVAGGLLVVFGKRS